MKLHKRTPDIFTWKWITCSTTTKSSSPKQVRIEMKPTRSKKI
jgi:hypothetical protein